MPTNFFIASEKNTERLRNNEEDTFRTEFQRDRDRILYSKEFRRLSGKTQVFISGFDDHMRTRLTHTLEVSQISDTIARKLGFNEILVEAIAYGHDVGHTPFGHVGERTLNLIMNGCKDIYNFNKGLKSNEKGFKHNLQGLRVVNNLENLYGKQNGLNLTKYTLWGILNHSNKSYKACEYYSANNICRLQNRNVECHSEGQLVLNFYDVNELNEKSDWTFEAVIVATADEIAQRHHDIEDGIYAGILRPTELALKFKQIFLEYLGESELGVIEEILKAEKKSTAIEFFSKLIVDLYTRQYISHLHKILDRIEVEFNINHSNDFQRKKAEIYDFLLYRMKKLKIVKTEQVSLMQCLGFEESFSLCDKVFQKYLMEKILYSELAQSMDGKSDFIIRQLFKAYLSNPQQLPDKTIEAICIRYSELSQEALNESFRDYLKHKLLDHKSSTVMEKIVLRTVCDYIAGMTDHYALNQYEKLYGAQKFRNY